MRIEIKSWIDGRVLFVHDAEENSVAITVRAGVVARADLSGADLYRANLYRANLYGADLSGADLSGADLYRANLYGANLSGADLSGADLSGADLSGANLYGANLSGANAVIGAGTPDGWTTFGWLFDGKLMLRVGCRNKTVREAREYWANKADRREVLLAIEYVVSVAKVRGWTAEVAASEAPQE